MDIEQQAQRQINERTKSENGGSTNLSEGTNEMDEELKPKPG